MSDDPTKVNGSADGAAAPGRPNRPSLPKRFYKEAAPQAEDGGYVLTLDGRPARTPGRKPLVVPGRDLAQAIAAEWNAQGESIDPASMPLTKLANTAIDGVAAEVEAVRADIARYAASDLVYYRAGEPDRLVRAQEAAWDPVIAWARESLGATLVMSVGITFVEQPEAALARIRAVLDSEQSPFALAALHVLTTLSGSVLIALMHAAGAIDADKAWAIAHVDEHHQESFWGEDLEAAQRRERRQAEFRAASSFLGLSRAA
jgi:chaperone required for assembly of F1-ATPase